jgi:DNA-binding ferritin-like protein (Dps family)
MTAKEMIQLNNERREKLNKENKKYYEDMLLYIRMSDVAEQDGEELLLEILEHLLEAQENGQTAEEVFGEQPKKYCDELLGDLPKEPLRNKLLMYFYITASGMAWYFLVDGIFSLFFPTQKGLPLTPVIVSVIFMGAVVLLILRVMKWTTYKKKSNIWLFSAGFLIFVIWTGILVYLELQNAFQYEMFWPMYTSLVAAVILFSLSAVLRYRVLKF